MIGYYCICLAVTGSCESVWMNNINGINGKTNVKKKKKKKKIIINYITTFNQENVTGT